MRIFRTRVLSGIAACALMLPASVPLTGCTLSAALIKADGAAVAQAIQNIAAVEQAQGNAADVAKLTEVAQGLIAATANFQTGSGVAILNDAATAAEIVLADIPATSKVAPLIPIAVAALDLLVANAGGSKSSGAVASHAVVFTGQSADRLSQMRASTKIQHRLLRSPEGDFKAAWNGTVKANSLPDSLAIK